MLLSPRLDPGDIEKERQVITEEINQSNDYPPHRVDILIDKLLWPDHPLGRDIAGSRESVATISREALLDYLQSHYLPQKTVVSVAGNIQPQEVIETVSQATAGWHSQRQPAGYVAYKELPAPRLNIETRDTEQAHLCLALPGLSLFHPQRFALDLLNIILGEGMSSRLFTEIRDRLGLVYGIQSGVEHFLDSGSLTISASTEPKNLTTVIEAILEQLARLKEKIPEAELQKAKEITRGRLLLRMEDSRSVAGWAGGQEVLTERIMSPDEVISIVSAITADDIQHLAGELIAGRQLRLAVVGPIDSDEPLDELLKL